MIPLYSVVEVVDVDKRAIIDFGFPSLALMENAAQSLFDKIHQNVLELGLKSKVDIYCGKGNNGGDGFALARKLLNASYEVRVIAIFPPDSFSHDAKINYALLTKLQDFYNGNLQIIDYNSWNTHSHFIDSPIIIDAILGSGATGELNSPIADIVIKLNKIKSYKIAIDIPTGVDAQTGYAGEITFNADLTICLGNFKRGLFFGRGYNDSGKIVIGDIGIPNSLYANDAQKEFLITHEDVKPLLPKKMRKINKYSAGSVFVIAGSKDYPGAGVLTLSACQNAGAGSFYLAIHESVFNVTFAAVPEGIFSIYSNAEGYLKQEHLSEFKVKLSKCRVFCIGPGIGRADATMKAVRKIVEFFPDKIKLIDADAIAAFSSNVYKKYNLKNSIFTPHLGEFSLLIGLPVAEIEKDLTKYGNKFCAETGAYLVLKGPSTIIFTPAGKMYVVNSGSPAIAKFGSGDVLSGMLSALLSQSKNIEESLILGVYLHGLCGCLAAEKFSDYSVTASKLIDFIPSAIIELRK